jgi:putative nucleotidyltransferase with HDIG domain
MNIACDEKIKYKIKNITDVPTIPVVISRLIRTLQNDKASIEDISGVIRHDQSIAARIVAVANSPFFGYQGRINSIEQAVLMLGFDMVRSISLSASVFGLLPAPYRAVKQIWVHSYMVAVLSGLMCSRVPVANKGICFLAGLLHDIGRVVLMSFYKNEYPVLIKPDNFIEKEKNIFQCSHSEAGGYFLESLYFPEEIVLPLYHHHDIGEADKHKGIATTVYLAEGLISILNPEFAYDGQWTEEHARVFEDIGLDENDIAEFKSYLTNKGEHINNFFEL